MRMRSLTGRAPTAQDGRGGGQLDDERRLRHAVALHVRALPRWASTIWRAMGSPSPVPRALVVKNGWKMRSCISGGMPAPEFPTITRTYSLAVRLDPHVHRAVRGRRLQRILDQVREHLGQPERIAPHRRHRVGVAALDRQARVARDASPRARRAPPEATPPATSRARAARASAGSPPAGSGDPRRSAPGRCTAAAGRPAARSACSSSRSPRMVASGVRISCAMRAAMPPEEGQLIGAADLLADAPLLGGVAEDAAPARSRPAPSPGAGP